MGKPQDLRVPVDSVRREGADTPLIVNCPRCFEHMPVDEFYTVNPKVGVYDNRTNVRPHMDTSIKRRQGRLMISAKKSRLDEKDGKRKLAFYCDYRLTDDEVAYLLVTRFGSDDSLYPRTRGLLLQWVQQTLTDQGPPGRISPFEFGSPAVYTNTLRYVYHLLPDLKPDYMPKHLRRGRPRKV